MSYTQLTDVFIYSIRVVDRPLACPSLAPQQDSGRESNDDNSLVLPRARELSKMKAFIVSCFPRNGNEHEKGPTSIDCE